MDGERDACLRLVAFAVAFAVSFIMERNDFMVAYYSCLHYVSISNWHGFTL